MTSNINQRIYEAQCIGNVEPIEYMIPYPSMRSLIEGQNIKYSKQILIEENNINILQYYTLIQQAANWLTGRGIKPKERLILPKLKSPQSEILLHSLWQIGATAVLSKDTLSNKYKTKFKIKTLRINNLFKEIKTYSKTFYPKHKPLLNEEALITFEKKHGIRLSHYNLLVNTNGLTKLINQKGHIRYLCDVDFFTISWVIFKAILPIYCGYNIVKDAPELTIGKSNTNFNLRFDLINLKKFKKNDIAICPENSGSISIGNKTIHLTKFSIRKNMLQLQGHSVMMGYLDQKINNESFKKNSLIIPI